MSQTTKKKHVAREVLDDFALPSENQKIVKVTAGRGNNLHQVVEADSCTTYLVSMPTKFRKSVWIKRGDYCVVEPIAEGDKVKAEIVRILYKEQIRHIKSEGQWPFKDTDGPKVETDPSAIVDEQGELVQNVNRKVIEYSDYSSSEEESEEGEN